MWDDATAYENALIFIARTRAALKNGVRHYALDGRLLATNSRSPTRCSATGASSWTRRHASSGPRSRRNWRSRGPSSVGHDDQGVCRATDEHRGRWAATIAFNDPRQTGGGYWLRGRRADGKGGETKKETLKRGLGLLEQAEAPWRSAGTYAPHRRQRPR